MSLLTKGAAQLGRLFSTGFQKAGKVSIPGTRTDHGHSGEKAAARFLQRQGYKILVRNYRVRWGEIDLVCRHEGVLVFVEVKTRSEGSWGSPAEAVTHGKQRRLVRAARSYLSELDVQGMPVRFDVVEVRLAGEGSYECSLIRAAFDLPEKAVRA